MADDAIAANALSPAVPKPELAGLPTLRLDPANPPKLHGGDVIGIATLHLVWDI